MLLQLPPQAFVPFLRGELLPNIAEALIQEQEKKETQQSMRGLEGVT